MHGLQKIIISSLLAFELYYNGLGTYIFFISQIILQYAKGFLK